MLSRKVRKAVREFIAEVDPTIAVRFQEYDLECDLYDEIVYVGETYNRDTRKYFMDFARTIAPQCEAPYILLALLHEIGHIMTWDEEDEDEKDLLYGLLMLTYDERDPANVEEHCQMYYRIPLERNATEWGIKWALAHPHIIDKYKFLESEI